jgi:hypothetical protein
MHVGDGSAYNVLVGKSESKSSSIMSVRILEFNIKMDVKFAKKWNGLYSPSIEFFLIGIVGGGGGGVQLGPHATAAPIKPILPAPGDYDDGEKCGMMIGKGNRSTRRKPALGPLCPPQTPHAARMRTWAAAVGSQRLTV